MPNYRIERIGAVTDAAVTFVVMKDGQPVYRSPLHTEARRRMEEMQWADLAEQEKEMSPIMKLIIGALVALSLAAGFAKGLTQESGCGTGWERRGSYCD